MSDNSLRSAAPVSESRKPGLSRPLCLSVLLGFTTAFGYWIGEFKFAGPPANAGLTVPAERLFMGDLWAQEGFQWVLRVDNSSDQEVSVRDVKSTCGCTSVKPQSFTLAPGGSQDLRMTFDLSARALQARAPPRRTFDVDILPVIVGSRSRATSWKMSATIKRAFAVEPSSFNYSGLNRIIVGGSRPISNARITPYEPVSHFEVDCPAHLGVARVTRDAESPGDFVLTFSPSNELPVGDFSGEVSLAAVLESGDTLPALSVSVSGMAQSKVFSAPSEIRLIEADERPMEETLLLQSTDAEGFTVLTVAADSDQIAIEEVATPAGTAGRSYRVRTAGTVGAKLSSGVTFETRSSEGALSTVKVPVMVYCLSEERKTAQDAQ